MPGQTLNELLDLQARSWQQGERVRVETLLNRPDVDAEDRELVCSLLVGEILLRRAGGEAGDLYAEYLSRFPSHAADIWEEAALPNWMSDLGDHAGSSLAPPSRPRSRVRPGQPPQPASPSNDTETVWAQGSTRPESPGSTPATESLATLPDYELLRELGRGGFGTVWLARNLLDHSLTALKLLKPGREVEIEGIRAYRRCSTQHPHLLPILHVGQTGSRVYYTMPLADPVAGSLRTGPLEAYQPETLGARHRRLGPLSTTDALELFHQVLSGLRELHRNGVVHSDVKPDNILRVGGVWRLGDLGLAVARESGGPHPGSQPPARGTRAYWPPEGCSGRTTDDLFALARTIAQVWSPETPPTSPRPVDAIRPAPDADETSLAPAETSRVNPLDPTRPAPRTAQPSPGWTRPLSQWLAVRRSHTLAGVLARALSADPTQRFASAKELARALPGVSSTRRTPVRPASHRVAPTVGWLVAGTASVALLLSATGVGSRPTDQHPATLAPAQPAGNDPAASPAEPPANSVVADTTPVPRSTALPGGQPFPLGPDTEEEGIADELVDENYSTLRRQIHYFRHSLISRRRLPANNSQAPDAASQPNAVPTGDDADTAPATEGLPQPAEIEPHWPELAIEVEELLSLARRLPAGEVRVTWGEELFRSEPPELLEPAPWVLGVQTPLLAARIHQDHERSWVAWEQRRLAIIDQLGWDRLPWHRAATLWRLASARRDVVRRLRYFARQDPPEGLEPGERQAWLDEADQQTATARAEVAQAIAGLQEEFGRRNPTVWRFATVHSSLLRQLQWLDRQFELQANTRLDRLPSELERELQELAPWLESGRLSAHDRASLGLSVRLMLLQRAECGYRRAELDPNARRPLLAKAEEELQWSRQVLWTMGLSLSTTDLERWRQAEADVLQVRLGSGF